MLHMNHYYTFIRNLYIFIYIIKLFIKIVKWYIWYIEYAKKIKKNIDFFWKMWYNIYDKGGDKDEFTRRDVSL